jgi:hypothetical protein
MADGVVSFTKDLNLIDEILKALPPSDRSRDAALVYKAVAQKAGVSAQDFNQACGKGAALGLLRLTDGKIARLNKVHKEERSPRATDWTKEKNLYLPVLRYLRLSFPRHPSVAAGLEVFATVTANARRLQSVPDLLLLSRYSHTILQYTQPDIYTFEVKTRDNIKQASPAQASSQGHFANYRYLVWHCSDRRHREDLKYTLRSYCEALGVGLIILSDPYNHASYDLLVSGKRHDNDPKSADKVLSSLLTQNQNRRIRDWLQRADLQP